MLSLSDAQIAEIHPQHNQASIKRLLSQFNYFKQGNCVVHHMFGADVVAQVRSHYPDAFHTAHLEVPGEMFELAVEAQRAGRGVVGSTSNILNLFCQRPMRRRPNRMRQRYRWSWGLRRG